MIPCSMAASLTKVKRKLGSSSSSSRFYALLFFAVVCFNEQQVEMVFKCEEKVTSPKK